MPVTPPSPVVLLVEGDIMARHPLAEFLRGCGFTVFEAANGDEAKRALKAPELGIEIVLADMNTAGSGFSLRQWIRTENPAVEVVLAGSVRKTVEGAGKLCNEGPGLDKPYDHRRVLDHIRQLMARRDRSKP